MDKTNLPPPTRPPPLSPTPPELIVKLPPDTIAAAAEKAYVCYFSTLSCVCHHMREGDSKPQIVGFHSSPKIQTLWCRLVDWFLFRVQWQEKKGEFIHRGSLGQWFFRGITLLVKSRENENWQMDVTTNEKCAINEAASTVYDHYLEYRKTAEPVDSTLTAEENNDVFAEEPTDSYLATDLESAKSAANLHFANGLRKWQFVLHGSPSERTVWNERFRIERERLWDEQLRLKTEELQREANVPC